MASSDSSESLSLLDLFFAILCPLAVAAIDYQLDLGLTNKLLVGVVRSIVQLFFAGYVLLSYIFSMNSPLSVVGYLFCMIMIASR